MAMNFLQSRSNTALRRELRGIQESYHHYWDLLAELTQNARDAVLRAARQGKHGPLFIHIKVDATTRCIEVTDNGAGISNAKLAELLAPGGSDKSPGTGEIGEKGVGLTYCLFCGDDFHIETKASGEAAHAASVRNARSWLMAAGDTAPPSLEISSASDFTIPPVVGREMGTPSVDSFTAVRLGKLPPPTEDQDVFTLTAAQLKFLLRTRTALGATDTLFEAVPAVPYSASYEFILGGERHSGLLESSYPLPHTLTAADDSMRLKDVQKAFVSKTTDQQRRKFLRGKTLWETAAVGAGPESIQVYGVMFPGNSVFSDLSGSSLGLGAHGPDETHDYLFRSGIFLATKRMPTGVSLDTPSGGRYPAYYKRCLFIVESDSIRFDLGRKSMHWRVQRRLQSAVASLFKQLEEVATYQSDEKVKPGPGAHGIESKAERDAAAREQWRVYHGLVDLKCSKISYAKVPDGQEAAVAAIFHELIGAGQLSGYRTLATGYSDRYDLHVLFNKGGTAPQLELVIEFKHSLESLIRDLENGRKNFSDIHLLVAWDANEQKLKDAGFHLDVTSSPQLPGVTHDLTVPIPGSDEIPVILLSDFVKKVR